MLRLKEENLSGLFSIVPQRFTDHRGYFFEAYQSFNYSKLSKGLEFVQDNVSKSSKGTLRGLHFQSPPYQQGKLVQVLNGSVLDVAVDLRRSSPTYGRHFKKVLSAQNGIQLYIPPGFAHGFLALENETLFSYKCTHHYHSQAENCLMWNDPILAIDWELDNDPLISSKDENGLAFDTFFSPFE